MPSKGDDTKSRRITLYNSTEIKTALQLVDTINGSNKSYTVFGSHNKPSGSYTGNGSTSERKINCSGLSNVISIWSTYGDVLIINTGAICRSSETIVAIGGNYCSFQSGTLTLKTENNMLNANGVNYFYQVL